MNAATIIFASLYPPQTIITPPPPIFFLRTLFGDPPYIFATLHPPSLHFRLINRLDFLSSYPFWWPPTTLTPHYLPPPPRFFLSSYPFRWPPYIFVTLLPLPYIFASLPPPPPWFFVFVRFSVTPLCIFASLPPPPRFFVFVPFSVTPPRFFFLRIPFLVNLPPPLHFRITKPPRFFIFVPLSVTPHYIFALLAPPNPLTFSSTLGGCHISNGIAHCPHWVLKTICRFSDYNSKGPCAIVSLTDWGVQNGLFKVCGNCL